MPTEPLTQFRRSLDIKQWSSQFRCNLPGYVRLVNSHLILPILKSHRVHKAIVFYPPNLPLNKTPSVHPRDLPGGPASSLCSVRREHRGCGGVWGIKSMDGWILGEREGRW